MVYNTFFRIPTYNNVIDDFNEVKFEALHGIYAYRFTCTG